MKAKYFPDTDTLLLTFSESEIVESYDINEDVLLDVNKDGHIVNMTVEHATKQTNVNEFSYQLAAIAQRPGNIGMVKGWGLRPKVPQYASSTNGGEARGRRAWRFRPCACAFWMLCGLISLPCSGAPANEEQRCRVAVLADKDAEMFAFIPLLEVRLSQQKTIELLERQNLAAVVQEQNLAALSSAGSCADRLALGRLVHADLLLILTRSDAQRPAVRLVVSDTRQGLRLRAIDVALSTNAEADAEILVRELEKARRKSAEDISLICAVPPMVSEDLTRNRDHLQASYSHILEEMLLGMPGTLVVDTEEARAIGREVMLSGGDMVPRLPVYLLGEFRFDTGNAQQPPAVKLVLRQGERELGRRQMNDASPLTAPDFLRRAALDLLALVAKGPVAEPDAQTEAKELETRARRFYELGTYPEAASLAEASLLLEPNRAQVRRLAMSAYGRCAWGVSRKPAEAIALSEWALEHAEPCLRMTDIGALDDALWANLANDLSEALGGVWLPVSDPDAKRLYASYQTHCRDAYRRVIEAKAREGALTARVTGLLLGRWIGLLADTCDTLEQNLVQRQTMLSTLLSPTVQVACFTVGDVVTDGINETWAKKPAYGAFLAAIEKQYNHPDLSAAVRKQRACVERLGEEKRPRPVMAPDPKAPEDAPVPAGPAEVAFRRIQWNRDGKEFRFCGVLPCGTAADFVWGYKPYEGARAYLMRKPGDMEQVIAEKPADCRAFGKPAYDGQYVWLALRGTASRLVAVEVATGAAVTVGEAQGLPPFTYAALTALTSGKICFAGCFGAQKALRTFVAVVNLDQTRTPSVRIIHEAARQLDLGKDQRMQRLDAQLGFVPKLMVGHTNAAGKVQVVIGRSLPGGNGRDSALLIDADSGQAQVMASGVESHILEPDVQYREGAAYWVTREGLRRLSADSTNNAPVCPVPEEGKVGFTADGRVHLAGAAWWVADRLGGPFRRFETKIPVDRSDLSSFYASTCYGLVLQASKNGEWGEYEVIFPGETVP